MKEEQPRPTDSNKTGRNDRYTRLSRLDIINETLVTTFDTGPFFESLLTEKRELERNVLPPKVNIVKNE